MKHLFINPNDLVFTFRKGKPEFTRVQAVSLRMAFAGAMRFKRLVTDNIENTLEIPAADRVPLAPVYILLTHRSYKKFKLHKHGLLPIMPNTRTNGGTNSEPAAAPRKYSSRNNSNKPPVIYTKPCKRMPEPAAALTAI